MTYRCRSFHCGPDRRTAVYRLYDKNERLLYAGIAYDYAQRWAEHAREKEWWPKVAYSTAVTHETRLGAAIEEYCAIRYENPLHNVSREHDRRLGVERTMAPGFHEPRPWRLHLITTAKRMDWTGAVVESGVPHHPAVLCADQAGMPPGVRRAWFPRIPDLGVVELESSADAYDYQGLHAGAADAAGGFLGLNTNAFTVSVHQGDRCPEPVRAEPELPPEPEEPTRRERLRAGGHRALKWYDRIIMGWYDN